MARSQSLLHAMVKSHGLEPKGDSFQPFVFMAPRSSVIKSFVVSEPKPFIHTLGFSVRDRSAEVRLVDTMEGDVFTEHTVLQDFEIPYISILLGEEDPVLPQD